MYVVNAMSRWERKRRVGGEGAMMGDVLACVCVASYSIFYDKTSCLLCCIVAVGVGVVVLDEEMMVIII